MAIPTSTYRLQFRDGMTFDRAIDLIPHWKDLGISHLYCSPIFAATRGSTHGYDVTDPNLIDPEIGGREGFDRLAEALRQEGFGLILDIVPNHLAASLENPWWRDSVEWGRESPFAHYFDCDWSRKLTLPVLAGPLENELREGHLALAFDRENGVLALDYLGSLYPLHPKTYGMALRSVDHPLAAQLSRIADEARPEAGKQFHAGVRRLIQENVDAFSEELHKKCDPDFLADLHSRQSFQLIPWREAANGLNYRRFFEITGLVGMRVEEREVFDAMHRTVLDMVARGQVDGLRIDHIDGLADPEAYLQRLRDAVGWDIYIVVEKILEHDEQLPSQWPVHGTTGYEFIAALSEILPDHEKPGLDDAYLAISPDHADPATALYRAKELMADVNFRGEVHFLQHLASEIAAGEKEARTLKPDVIESAVREVLIIFPVYRTYGSPRGLYMSDAEVLSGIFGRLCSEAGQECRAGLDFVQRILRGEVSLDNAAKALRFRTRLQHLTGPLLAKALEDTFFYRYHRLIALNEVGCDPAARHGSVDTFHAKMRKRVMAQPTALNATSTHDTKRGEDARARLYAISEAPQLWNASVARWRDMHMHLIEPLADGPAPEPNLEWMIYQALAGAWPFDIDVAESEQLASLKQRFLLFVEKALREAKLRTNWTDGDADYERAVARYVDALLSEENTAFLHDFGETLRPLIETGLLNSMTQTLLKLTAPGIPDIYQGCEGLDFSLVDPDNRRPPDFEALAAEGGGSWPGRKKALVRAVLHLRRKHPQLFREGHYVPLEVEGPASRHVIAYARVCDLNAVIVIAPRLIFSFVESGEIRSPDMWHGTRVELPDDLPGLDFKDAFSRLKFDCASGWIALDQAFSKQLPALLIAE
jgi:(1->4)-alpha-D-glucan 1-alpha-D-glucosylmutase